MLLIKLGAHKTTDVYPLSALRSDAELSTVFLRLSCFLLLNVSCAKF